MIYNVVIQTNLRARQLTSAPGIKLTSRIRKWKDVVAAEIRVYLAILLYMGIFPKPERWMYWSTKPMHGGTFLSNFMSSNRFFLLDRCLHFTDTSVPLPADASRTTKVLWRIRPFFDAIINNFHRIYVPAAKIAIDESLMLWKGRLAVKQYIPLKRARFGLKLYQLCECGTGYIWNTIVHTGTPEDMVLGPAADNLTSSRMVKTLLRDLLGQGYRVYMDNWYSSPALFAELRGLGTDAVGTVRVSRPGMPPVFKLKNKQRGDTTALFTDQVMALQWIDKKPVTMLSTVHDAAMDTVRARERNQIVDKLKPRVILDYNENMGAVDVADQMLTAYPVEGKRKKVFYKKFFRHLLNQAMLNVYVVHKQMATKKLTHLELAMKLVDRLLEVGIINNAKGWAKRNLAVGIYL